MDERKANIDIAFRNGLKDFEVLPPPEMWDSIHSKISKKAAPVYYKRIAAAAAVFMALSILAYRAGTKISKDSQNSVAALNKEFSQPRNKNIATIPYTVIAGDLKAPGVPQKSPDGDTAANIEVLPEADNNIPDIIYLPESISLLPDNNLSFLTIRQRINPKISLETTFKLNTIDLQEYLADKAEKTTDHWSIAALASPTYYGKINTGSDPLSKQLMASEQAVVSYSGGVALYYKVNKRLSIQSGLFYSSVGQQVDGINSYAGFQKYDFTKGDHNFELRTTNGTVYTNNSDVYLSSTGSSRIVSNDPNDNFDPQKANLQYINNTVKQNFSYLELPVILRYKIIDRTIDFNLIGGLSYNLLMNNSVYTVIDGSKYSIGTTQGLNTFSISSSLGMGMEYNFSDRLSLNLEPTFRYYMNPYTEITSSHLHPYTFGIFSGISYKF